MPNYDRFEMTVDELKATHTLHATHKEFWNFMLASYSGIKALIDAGYVLYKHERESEENFKRRVGEAYGFGYSGSVVDLFNFYLFKNPAKREMGPLSNDKQWEMFEKDCNLYGDDFKVWMLETQRYAGILGHVGVLLDKSPVKYATKQQEIEREVYPYTARYFPQAILDWEYKRDEDNRPYLAYLKLLDDDGTYRIWTTEWWATYVIPEGAAQQTTVPLAGTSVAKNQPQQGGKDTSQVIKSTKNADNPFMEGEERGEIPFVWFYNIKSKQRPLGISDIKDVAYIDGSIIRNLSEGEEVITYAAFPMLLKPMQEAGVGGAGEDDQDDVGVTAVLEFDPEHPDAKPEWMEAKVLEPIDATLKWIENKVAEIYRATNAGGMASTEIQTQAKSGTALKSEFQLLNGKLVSKGNNAEESERNIKRLWCKWEGKEEVIDKLVVEWPETYDVANLAEDLENALTAKTLIASNTFRSAIQKQVARAMLPNASNDTLKDIDDEIDESVEKDDAASKPGNVPGTGGPGDGNIPGAAPNSQTPGQLVPLPTAQQPKAAASVEGD